jgi:putative endonuclease
MIEYGYVYILASGFKHLYIGVTSELEQRIRQHKNGAFSGSFTERYNIKHLVYFERFGDMPSAIAREKQLKRWSRIKKIRLIVAMNPDWRDLSEDWGKPTKPFDGKLREPVGFGQNTGVSPLRSTMQPSRSGRDDEH